MRSLVDYDILVNDVFYRSEHILEYIEKRKDISSLDKEALENTILDALVDNNLLDPTKESLDLNNLVVCDDLEHKVYESKPRVTSIPLGMKEKMRDKTLHITGGVPAAVFFAKPAGKTQFCIYDMNTAFSRICDEVTFINCTYDSPTRTGIRADSRPFIEIKYHGEKYYVDALTKRMFRKDWFDEEFNLEEIYRVSIDTFNKEQKEIYDEQTGNYLSYAAYISFIEPMLSTFKLSPKLAEMNYEIEKSKEYFPEQFELAEQMTEEFHQFMNQNSSKKIVKAV